ncbi:MAG: GDP-L-fucose synthase [Rhodovibrionaceae bacterium]
MVGSALLRRLESEDCETVTATRGELDLRDRAATRDWLRDVRPDAVFCAAAKVGGIQANDSAPADFLQENLEIQLSVIDASYRAGVGKLLFLGSSCIYPRQAPQPIPETALMTGPLEPTNQWYAVAKIAGIMQCQAYRRQHGCNFISAMPTNLFGAGDNYHPTNSHVVAALLRKAHEAKVADKAKLEIWGTGTPRREFLYADDCADALVFLMQHYNQETPVNVGTGEDITITELAETVARIVGYTGSFEYNLEKPDGMPRKLLDVSRIKALGWQPRTSLEDGLAVAYRDFCAREAAPMEAQGA